MKIRDANILIVPGYTNSGPDHWQTRWQEKMPNTRRVEQAEWSKPVREDWVSNVAQAIKETDGPIVLVAHSLGVAASVHAYHDAIEQADRDKIVGGFFVAPPEVTNPKVRPKHLMTFGPYPTQPLGMPTFVVASKNDPFGGFESAQNTAADWGAFLVDAGESGHINAESGHGPWPEGLMVFAEFMKRL